MPVALVMLIVVSLASVHAVSSKEQSARHAPNVSHAELFNERVRSFLDIVDGRG